MGRYGTCQVCGRPHSVRLDGNVRGHRVSGKVVDGTCKGSWCPPREDVTDGGHYFRFHVTVQGEDSDWTGDPFKLTVRAFSLQEACRKAADVRLPHWELPPEPDDD